MSGAGTTTVLCSAHGRNEPVACTNALCRSSATRFGCETNTQSQLRSVSHELREHPLLASRRRAPAVQRPQIRVPICQRVNEEHALAALTEMPHVESGERGFTTFVAFVQIDQKRDHSVTEPPDFLVV